MTSRIFRNLAVGIGPPKMYIYYIGFFLSRSGKRHRRFVGDKLKIILGSLIDKSLLSNGAEQSSVYVICPTLGGSWKR